MKTLNKSLLAAAVIGLVALPGASFASVVGYNIGGSVPHHIFARDNILPSTVVRLPTTLQVKAQASDGQVWSAGAVNPNDDIRVRITLTGAEFSNTYADATQFAQAFRYGTQFGVPSAVVGAVTNAGFSGSNGRQELAFDFKAPGSTSMTLGGSSDVFLHFPDGPSPALFTELAWLNPAMGAQNGSAYITITIQNVTTQQILFTTPTTEIAKSVVGERIFSNDTTVNPNKTIDVGSSPVKYTRYSPSGIVGASTGTGSTYYNAGDFNLDVTREGSVPVYNATAPNAYSLYNGTKLTVVVSGDNFAPWASMTDGIWLSANPTCDGVTKPMAINTVTNTASITIASTDPWYTSIETTGSPAPTPLVNVCFGSNGTTPLIEQPNLSGQVRVRHLLPPQFREDLADLNFNLRPLLFNGTVLYFQNVNPGGNVNAQSFLRLSNHNNDICPVFIDAKDDRGRLSREVALTLAKHESEQLNIDALEAGVDNQTQRPARFTTGLGTSPTPGAKWYVRVAFHCDNVTATAWNRNLTTLSVTDLTAEKRSGAQWSTPTDLIP